MVLPGLKLISKVISTNFGFFNPFELNFAITYRCNSKCRTCFIWKMKQKNELSLKEIKKISKKLDFIHWIRLTGGEPFLRKDYVDIMKTLDKNIPDLYMITTPTNGLLPDLIFEKVKRVLKFFDKTYIITVSLDGPKKIHEKIRGVKGSWNKAIETYRRLKQLENQHKNFKVFFGYTISPFNLGFFKQTVEEIKKIFPEITPNDFHVNLFQTSDVYYKNVNQRLNKDYPKKARKEIDVILKSRNNSMNPIDKIETKYLELGKEYLKKNKIPINCNVFNLSCFVDPFGNVFPCSIFNKRLGNLKESDYDLKKILVSEDAKKIKEEIIDGKCPQCWTPCEAHQMIISNWLKI